MSKRHVVVHVRCLIKQTQATKALSGDVPATKALSGSSNSNSSSSTIAAAAAAFAVAGAGAAATATAAAAAAPASAATGSGAGAAAVASAARQSTTRSQPAATSAVFAATSISAKLATDQEAALESQQQQQQQELRHNCVALLQMCRAMVCDKQCKSMQIINYFRRSAHKFGPDCMG